MATIWEIELFISTLNWWLQPENIYYSPIVSRTMQVYHEKKSLRGGVTKKKSKNIGEIPKGGGGEKHTQKFPISI